MATNLNCVSRDDEKPFLDEEQELERRMNYLSIFRYYVYARGAQKEYEEEEE